MRQANRSLRCPTRVRTLFVEPLEDRLVLSSITPASASPSVLANHQDEIVSIVPIGTQRDAAKSNSASNDATPDDDYDEPTTPNSASDASGESAETIDESSESPGEVYPEIRDPRSSYATAQMDAMKKYEAEFFGPNPYEQPLMANPAIAQHVDIVSSTASRQSSHPPAIPVTLAKAPPPPSEGLAPAVALTQGPDAIVATRQLSADDLDLPEQSQADHLQATPENVSNESVAQSIATLDSRAVEEPPPPELVPRSLLAGTLPLDLQALRQAANEALARLESLGDQLATAAESWNLLHFLFVATFAAGAVEFVRRYRKRTETSVARQTDSLVEPCWEPLLVLAVRWPDGEP